MCRRSIQYSSDSPRQYPAFILGRPLLLHSTSLSALHHFSSSLSPSVTASTIFLSCSKSLFRLLYTPKSALVQGMPPLSALNRSIRSSLFRFCENLSSVRLMRLIPGRGTSDLYRMRDPDSLKMLSSSDASSSFTLATSPCTIWISHMASFPMTRVSTTSPPVPTSLSNSTPSFLQSNMMPSSLTRRCFPFSKSSMLCSRRRRSSSSARPS